MKFQETDLYSLLTACAACVVQAGTPEDRAEAGRLILRRQTELRQALASRFITPMERGDLYLPACLCAQQIRLLGPLCENPLLRQRFLICARRQQSLLSSLSEFQRPESLLLKCEALRREAREACSASIGSPEGRALFDAFSHMADLVEYLVLKNS